MREFKFRAWNNQENEMVDLVTVGSREVDKNRSTWPALYYRKSDGIITGFDHEDYEVLQYTGLKHKNGVEIYEGDILKGALEPHEINGPVYYTNRGTWDYDSFLLGDLSEKCKVIGNIYENPELLIGESNGPTR